MDIKQTREKIDTIDGEIKSLILKRLELSREVAEGKIESGDITIFRPDREEEILDRLGKDLPPDVKACYLPIVRKIMETSRMFQYGIIFDEITGLFEPLAQGVKISSLDNRVRVRLTRDNRPNAMSSILSMIGDYGFNMDNMKLITQDENHVTFELLIIGNLGDVKMQKLMFQLSCESRDFAIIFCGNYER